MLPALGPSDRDISGFGFSAGFPASRVCWVRRTVIWPRGSSSGWRSALGFRKWLNHAVCRAGTSLAQADLEFMSSILPPQSGVRPQRISWSKLAAPLGLTAGVLGFGLFKRFSSHPSSASHTCRTGFPKLPHFFAYFAQPCESAPPVLPPPGSPGLGTFGLRAAPGNAGWDFSDARAEAILAW